MTSTMPCVRHIIVCEGESEHAYLQRLQSFLDSQPLPQGSFEPPLRFIGPMPAIAKGGAFGKLKKHFTSPLHARDDLPEIKRIFPSDGKGALPVDFISWPSLKNLKANLCHQPTSNPHSLQGVGKFADFLIGEIDRAYPGKLD